MSAAPIDARGDEHCYHHSCDMDYDACAAGDCYDEDDCVHCECCCTCLSCEYAPQDGMLLFDPTAPEPFTPPPVARAVLREPGPEEGSTDG